VEPPATLQETFPLDQVSRHLLRDRESIFGLTLRGRFRPSEQLSAASIRKAIVSRANYPRQMWGCRFADYNYPAAAQSGVSACKFDPFDGVVI
jgi:hypothetical protein